MSSSEGETRTIRTDNTVRCINTVDGRSALVSADDVSWAPSNFVLFGISFLFLCRKIPTEKFVIPSLLRAVLLVRVSLKFYLSQCSWYLYT